MDAEILEASLATGSLERRTRAHRALGDPQRLAIVDELSLSDRSPAELRMRLGIQSNLLAHHLAVLEETGFLERTVSAGDRRRRYLRLVPDALDLICRGPGTIHADRLLFVCTRNSARSQIAVALWNTRHPVPAESAGTEPAERVHPEATRAASRAGLDLSGVAPRSLEAVRSRPDLLVTVCDRAHERLGGEAELPRRLHWSIPDPAEAGAPSAFDESVRSLAARIEALAPLVSARNRTQSRRSSA